MLTKTLPLNIPRSTASLSVGLRMLETVRNTGEMALKWLSVTGATLLTVSIPGLEAVTRTGGGVNSLMYAATPTGF